MTKKKRCAIKCFFWYFGSMYVHATWMKNECFEMIITSQILILSKRMHNLNFKMRFCNNIIRTHFNYINLYSFFSIFHITLYNYIFYNNTLVNVKWRKWFFHLNKSRLRHLNLCFFSLFRRLETPLIKKNISKAIKIQYLTFSFTIRFSFPAIFNVVIGL